MAKCDRCDDFENMPYRCRYCGGTFCGDHRLPENHDCPGLDEWDDPGGVFDSGFDDSVATEGRSTGSVASRLGVDTGPGGVWAYFRGNVTYTFLALMWITWFVQWVVAPLAGLSPNSPTWEAIFVISNEHPFFVWTWFTSIFAHAPPGFIMHIVGNSIVIYFFGRLVERYVGSRNFALLFLGSGVLAGLGQIALFQLQGVTSGAYGASGAGLAIMGVLTVLNPNLRVYLYFLLPVPIWVITGFYALASVVGILAPVGAGGVANGAHLVGLVIGLAYGEYVSRKGLSAPERLEFGGGRGPRRPGGPGGRF